MKLIPNGIQHTKYFLMYSGCIFVITLIVTYFIKPNVLDTIDSLANKVDKNLAQNQGLMKVWMYVFNNGIKVPIQMLFLTLLPIPFLYCLNLTITAILPAILIGIVSHINLHKAIMLGVSALPHFFLELLGYSLLVSCLYRLNLSIYQKFYAKLWKNHLQTQPLILKNEVSNTLKCYFVGLLPCIAVAGFFETFIADLIMKL